MKFLEYQTVRMSPALSAILSTPRSGLVWGGDRVAERWLFRIQGDTPLTISPSALVSLCPLELDLTNWAEKYTKQCSIGDTIPCLESDCLGLLTHLSTNQLYDLVQVTLLLPICKMAITDFYFLLLKCCEDLDNVCEEMTLSLAFS